MSVSSQSQEATDKGMEELQRVLQEAHREIEGQVLEHVVAGRACLGPFTTTVPSMHFSLRSSLGIGSCLQCLECGFQSN